MPEQKLNFWQRARMAVNFAFTGETKRQTQANSKTPYSTAVGYSNVPQRSLVDFQTFYEEGFNENSLIYAAIAYKAKAITQAKLLPYRYVDKNYKYQELDRREELYKLFKRPNPYQSGDEFHSLQNAFFNLTGNAFTFLEREGQNVVKLWPLNPAWVEIIPNENGEILGYEYKPTYLTGEIHKIEYQNMAHWKLPNPRDPLNGLGFGQSPLNAMSMSGDVDNMITRFLNVFFKHGAMPPGILKFKDMALDENEIAEIREKWKETYGGYTNWSDIGVLDGQGDYQRIGLTFEEMNFEKLDQRNEARILSVLGVPVSLLPTVSALQGSTYNNKSQDPRMFWEDTMMYELEVVEQELGRIFNTDEIFLKWDISEVKALKNDVNVQIDSATKLINVGVPPLTAFDTVGLNIERYEGIEERLLSNSVSSIEMIKEQMAKAQQNFNQNRDDENSNADEAKNNPFLEQRTEKANWKHSQIIQ